MRIETEQLKERIRRELAELEQLRARLEAKLEAVETVERLAQDLAPEAVSDDNTPIRPPFGHPGES